jgi:hypothetical protein
MSSKDAIIADIIRVIKEQKEEQPRHFYNYHFGSIKSIRGIDCIVHLEIAFGLANDGDPNKFRALIKIIHPNMDDEELAVDHLYSKILGHYLNFDEENLSNALDKLLELLPTLQFSIFGGVFLTKPSMMTTEINFFQGIEGLELKGQKCCICQEHIVNTKTKCEHYLCVPCYQEINFVIQHIDCGEDTDDDDDECEVRPCPICRRDIRYTTA